MSNTPQIPIEVDSSTGVWQTDGLPMLYVPRHFFVNNHDAIEQAMGREAYAEILYKAGYKSAYHWCAHEAKQQSMEGMDVFHHYLKRLSQRGWGIFKFEQDAFDTPPLVISLEHSAFVLHARKFQQEKSGDTLCYMFSGWFAGAADWVAEEQGAPGGFVCREVECAGAGKSALCRYEIQRKDT